MVIAQRPSTVGGVSIDLTLHWRRCFLSRGLFVFPSPGWVGGGKPSHKAKTARKEGIDLPDVNVNGNKTSARRSVIGPNLREVAP